MPDTYLLRMLDGGRSKLLFALSFMASYFLIPQKVFYDGYVPLALGFMLTFALTFTCLFKNLKERIFSAGMGRNSLIGAIATVVGFSALQACGIGIPVCGATLGFTLLATLLPSFFLNLLMEYAVPLVVVSIAVQLAALYSMNCFRDADAAPGKREAKPKKRIR